MFWLHFSRIFLLLVGAYLILTEDMTIGGLTSIILLAELVGERTENNRQHSRKSPKLQELVLNV